MGRGDVHADEAPKGKKEKKMMPVLQKLEVLDTLDRGMKLRWSGAVIAIIV